MERADVSLKKKIESLVIASNFSIGLLQRSKRKKLYLSKSFFLDVHGRVLVYQPFNAGRYRKATDEIEIPKKTFVPAKPWQIEMKMVDLTDLINNRRRWHYLFRKHILQKINGEFSDEDKGILFKIFMAWYLHHQLVVIHPFTDGNGRVARLLMCLVLRREGLSSMSYPPLINIIIEKNKGEYLNKLNDADKGDYVTGVNYLGKILKNAYDLMQKSVPKKKRIVY